MPTLLDIKIDVAQQLGKTNSTTPVPLRDIAINSSRRTYYAEQPWSFTEKPADISLTSQLGSLPTDMLTKFPFKKVYTYIDDVLYEFSEVGWDELASYSSAAYVYAINKDTKQIKINQTDVATVSTIYNYLPADKALDTSDNTDVEPAPDITPIVYLAIARYWLSAERATGKFQMYKDLYDAALAGSRMDSDLATPRIELGTVEGTELGYNRPGYKRSTNTGYKK